MAWRPVIPAPAPQRPMYAVGGAGLSAAAAPPASPTFSFVKYLTNSGSPTDLSAAATTVTNTSVTSVSTPTPPFGGTALSFNGSTSKLVLGNTAKIAGEDFTVQGWIYITNTSDTHFIWSQYDGSGSGDFANRTIFYVGSDAKLGFQRGSNSLTGITTVTTNAWHYVEVTRFGGLIYMFLDGALQGTLSITGSMGNWSPTFGSSNTNPPAGSAYFPGYMSPLRVIIGSHDHTSAYTPPTSAFPTS